MISPWPGYVFTAHLADLFSEVKRGGAVVVKADSHTSVRVKFYCLQAAAAALRWQTGRVSPRAMHPSVSWKSGFEEPDVLHE